MTLAETIRHVAATTDTDPHLEPYISVTTTHEPVCSYRELCRRPVSSYAVSIVIPIRGASGQTRWESFHLRCLRPEDYTILAVHPRLARVYQSCIHYWFDDQIRDVIGLGQVPRGLPSAF